MTQPEASAATESIRSQVDDFNPGFNAQIGDRLAAVFADEQAALNEVGVPGGAVTVGDTLPDAALATSDGTPTTLREQLSGGPGVLVFYRGAWCPYCNIALRTYERDLVPALPEGVSLLAVSPQTPESSAKAVEGAELTFPALSDPAGALAAHLGILTAPSDAAGDAHNELGFDVSDFNADATRGIPYPTVLVVDADLVVRFVDVHVDYTTRTEVPEILEAVRAL